MTLTKTSKPFYFSFSSLSLLLEDPEDFHKKYILGEKEPLDEIYLKKGQILHCLVLEPQRFDDHFAISQAVVPTGGAKEVIDMMFKHHLTMYEDNVLVQEWTVDQYKEMILEYLVNINLYQAFVDDKKPDKDGVQLTADEKRLGKILTPQSLAYFNELKSSIGKTVIDMEMVKEMHEKARIIKAYDAANGNLLTETKQSHEVQHEVELVAENGNSFFGFKGVIDNIKVDYDQCKIYITDLKTTSGSLDEFRKSLEKYRYWLQVVIYKKLIMSLIPKDSKKDWTFEISFLVITKKNKVYNFIVSEESLVLWEEKANESFLQAEWHWKNNHYGLPYNYANNLVKL